MSTDRFTQSPDDLLVCDKIFAQSRGLHENAESVAARGLHVGISVEFCHAFHYRDRPPALHDGEDVAFVPIREIVQSEASPVLHVFVVVVAPHRLDDAFCCRQCIDSRRKCDVFPAALGTRKHREDTAGQDGNAPAFQI